DLLTDLVGAPMPEPNLMLDSEADFERWLHEWINWYTWLAANPTDDPDVLAVGFVPDTDEFERQIELQRTRIAENRFTLGWWSLVSNIRPSTSGAMFEQRVGGTVVFDASQAYPRYSVSGSGSLLEIAESSEGAVVAFSLRNGEEVGWRIEFITLG
ncbi:MAG: hypothetical protein OEW30_13195, partial [Acidimicrobiia bacterium]|nr:hypothetical protein [Acidimicrobiia bacterium]